MNFTSSTIVTKSDNTTLSKMYKLLSLNIGTSALATYFSLGLNVSFAGAIAIFISAILLLFALHAVKNTSLRLCILFTFTTLLGASLGPSINHLLNSQNGGDILVQALGITSVMFAGLSYYTIKNQHKDFSRLGTFVFSGLIVVIAAIILNMFLNIPSLSITISAAICLIMSAAIIYDTDRAIRENTDYISATASMYLNILNLFTSIIEILKFLNDE